MFNFISNLFRYKAKSIEEFVEIMKRDGYEKAIVKPYSAAKNGADTASVGIIADFQYMLEFTAKTLRGKKIVYRQLLFERFGSDRGLSDAEERRNAAVKLFLLGEQKVKELRAKLPGISIDLIGPNGPMDDVTYAKLHQDAVACGVSA